MRWSTLRLILVWVGIFMTSTIAVTLQSVRMGADPEGISELTPVEAERPSALSFESELTAKFLVGAHAWAPTAGSAFLLNAQQLRDGNTTERLAYALLVGRLESWQAGVDAANAVEIDRTTKRGAQEALLKEDVVGALETLAASNGDSASISLETRERMEEHLGFLGRVDTVEGVREASRALAVVLAAGTWYVCIFLAGAVALLVLLYRMAVGTKKPAFEPIAEGQKAIVLGETFALWLGFFLLCTVIAATLPIALNMASPDAVGENGSLVLSLAAMYASLLALAWPSVRGLSWRETRELIGLHKGAGVLREVGAGVVCYITAVPILLFGLIVYFLLSLVAQLIRGDQPPPSHPAVEMLSSAGPMGVVLLYLLASVTAPIVEEIAFRGLLFSHLRGVVAPRIRFVSFAVAALVSSFIFAVIHPQGVLFVPALGGLAVGFCLAREIRGSLIAPMVAHGINNAVTLTLAVSLFG